LTSYIIGGELLKNGVSLVAVLAFIVSWVTVGTVQLPAESLMLGRKFALLRNGISLIMAIAIAVAAGILSAGGSESKGYERCPDRHLSLQPGRKNPSSTHDVLLLRPQAGGDPDDPHDSVFSTERFAGRTIDSTEWRRTN